MERLERLRQSARKKIAAGEWLLPGEVAAVLGVSRATVDRWLVDDYLGWKHKAFSTWRLVNPQHVQAVIDDPTARPNAQPDAG